MLELNKLTVLNKLAALSVRSLMAEIWKFFQNRHNDHRHFHQAVDAFLNNMLVFVTKK